ncbi:MAG: hypothetical protein HQL69_10610 [Magnetococcales bacterium]|nr:hypothetical protein [Magnetococcales bacterium]
MWQKYKELTGNIMEMIHKNRVYAAQAELDKMLAEMPGFATELAVLAKLLHVGRETQPQGSPAVGETDEQQRLLEESMAILARSEQKVEKQHKDIHKLNQYLAKLHQYSSASVDAKNGKNSQQEELKHLTCYLDNIRGYRARKKLDVLQRTKGELNRLSTELNRAREAKSVVSPEVKKLKSIFKPN